MPFPYLDLPFYFACAAFALGLSLMTYRMLATRYQWPLGKWQAEVPALPILIGFACVAVAGLFALARGYSDNVYGGWAVPAVGVVLAILWTAFLRVGAQLALLLAPIATALLVVVWFGGSSALEYTTVRESVRQEFRELREQLGLPAARPREGERK